MRCAPRSAANAASASSFTAARARSASGRQAPPRGAQRRRRLRGERSDRLGDARDPARPRPESGRRSTARSSSSVASFVHSGRPARSTRAPASTRSRTGADASLGAAASSTAPRARHRDDEVEAIEQRPRELVPERASRCGEHLHSAAGSPRAPHGHRFIAADELEARREDRSAVDARDADDAVLERLAERLERRSLELRELVQDEDSPVRQADLTGPRPRAAADERRDGGAVVRRAEGREP